MRNVAQESRILALLQGHGVAILALSVAVRWQAPRAHQPWAGVAVQFS